MATRKLLDRGRGGRAQRLSSGPVRLRILVALSAGAAAAALAACSPSGASPSASSSGSSSAAASAAAATAVGLKTATVGGVTLLTSNKGFTVYSFSPDTSTKSTCNGTCAQSWPPVPATTSGVKAPFATIKRSDGSTQLTFDGHPLYTFVMDTAPGQANGNGLNIFGGVWHEAPANGSAAPAPPAGSSGGGGGGY
jgi:predicted lipoprotein with Yx(FWY)xxD motif